MKTHFRSIPAGYNLRQMTPRDMVRMSHELYEAGVISFKDHLQLSFQPDVAPVAPPGVTLRPDVPRDFIAQWEARLDEVARRNGIAPPAEDRHLLDLLRSLQAQAVDKPGEKQ